MPNFEFEYSNQDFQLVANQEDGTFGGTNYIRLTIYPTEAIDDIVTLSDNTEGVNGQAIFFSSLSETSFNINQSPFGNDLTGLDLKPLGGGDNDFQIYRNPNESIFIKPNEIFNKFKLPQGSYKVQIDFLSQLAPNPNFEIDSHYEFIIKQISTSRKEVRLKLKNSDIIDEDLGIIDNVTTQLNNGELEFLEDTDETSNTFGQFVIPNPNYKYQFKHVLNIGTGDHIAIMNYQFDRITSGRTNQSLILKLYNALPTNVTNLSMVTIEREVLTTQTENIYYFSDVAEVNFGDGLIADAQENWINPDGNDIQFENYNELSSSLDDITLDSLISQSEYGYPNLNTNFNEFENHTFFGSAKRKLENFKNKVETIQGHYSDISSSLSSVGEDTISSSTFLIQHRKNLFKKINNEIKTFSPYERFLYYDGQNESTASAPGIGLNYADTIPVRDGLGGDYEGALNGADGFNVVYHHSSKNAGGETENKYIDLFTNKYHAQNKPFFNHSGSIFLSFLVKGDSGSALLWQNANRVDYDADGVVFPVDSLHQNTLQGPNITGSEYRRYVYQASQSFWVPSAEIDNFDLANMEQSDFTAGSTKVELLSGITKTGSNAIKDSSGKWQNYTTVVTQSGVPFKGSVMPAGELFRIFTITELSSSLAGYYRFDETSGTLCEDASGNGFSGSLKFIDAGGLDGGGIRISGSSSDIGRQSSGSAAGNSLFFGETGSAFVQITSSLIPDSELATTDFSITAWINPTSQSQEFDTIVGKRDTEGNGFQFDIRDTDGANDGVHPFGIGFALQASGSSAIADQGTITIPSASWTHVAVTVDRSDAFKLFVNGVKTATSADISARGSGITGSGAFDNPFSIGARLKQDGTTSNRFGGGIDEVRFYKRALRDTEVEQLYLNPDGNINTKITDVRISLKDPTDVLPFDQLYHTSSTNWTNWYDGTYDSASAFDTDNIHSLENNLPLYIKESNDYNDLKKFLSIQGEQYDVIRNHIDSLGTLHDRGYKKTDSPPNNTLPMLLQNMGWNAINPFSGSLTDSLGGYLTSVTTIDDIKNNTWRKTLNNLLYIYKSKGTENSVRALLNVYGYPPDILKFQELGGSNDFIGDENQILPDFEPLPDGETDLDLDINTGSFGFTISKKRLYRYMFANKKDRILNLDWWMDSADISSFEFVYKHKKTTNTQTILKSSGSGAQHLWDLRLIPSTDGISSSFEFRLNNSQRGGTAIASRGYSMSLAYSEITDGQLWNVMVQRVTGSIVGAGIQEYRLHSALQKIAKIQPYNYVTMSVSGGLVGSSTDGGKGFFANQNFVGSGSRHPLSSSNLFVGETLSGSLSEIRGWNNAISKSKFRQHTFNKFSTVGNNVTSYEDDLIYHFKLNENYSSASVSSSNQTLKIVDSAPKCSALLTTDYSLQKSGNLFTGSIVYGFDIVDVVTFGFQDNIDSDDDSSIIINPGTSVNGNLSPKDKAYHNSPGEKPQIHTSPSLTLYNSPQDFVNNHILNNLDGFNFENYYGNPIYYHSSSYTEFDNLRKDFFKCNPIEVDTNTFIRAYESMFNHSITKALGSLVPARSTFSGTNTFTGVEIKPTILEKQKYDNEEHDVEANPNTATGSLSVISIESVMTGSRIETANSGSISVITPESVMSGSKIESPYSASIKVYDSGSSAGSGNATTSISSSIENPYSSSIVMLPSLIGSTLVLPHSGSIDYASIANKSFVNIHDSWGRGETDTHFVNHAAAADTNVLLTAASAILTIADGDADSGMVEKETVKIISTDGTIGIYAVIDDNATTVATGAILAADSDVGDGAAGSALVGAIAVAINTTGTEATQNDFLVQLKAAIENANSPLKDKITVSAVPDEANGAQSITLTQVTLGNVGNTVITTTISQLTTNSFLGGSEYGGGKYNSGHIDTRNHFYSIGDTEYYSASYGGASNFENSNRFFSKLLITNDFHSKITYQSFVNGNPGEQSGRAMGKTRYFFTASNGDIILPSNHVTKFSQPFKEQMYRGAQNTNPGFLNVRYEDYSSASFYSAKVTGGENELIIRVPGRDDLTIEPPSPQ